MSTWRNNMARSQAMRVLIQARRDVLAQVVWLKSICAENYGRRYLDLGQQEMHAFMLLTNAIQHLGNDRPKKRCTKCKQHKDINEFQPGQWTDRSPRCRKCCTKGTKSGGTPEQRRAWVQGRGLERISR